MHVRHARQIVRKEYTLRYRNSRDIFRDSDMYVQLVCGIKARSVCTAA